MRKLLISMFVLFSIVPFVSSTDIFRFSGTVGNVTSVEYSINLNRGWNMISYPGIGTYDYYNLQVEKDGTVLDIEDGYLWIQTTFYYYDEIYKLLPEDSVVLESWRGYWVYSNYDVRLLFP